METIAYFTVAELLANVTRHSGAAHARVDATTTADQLMISVWDELTAAERPKGLAPVYPAYASRAATVDGTLTI